MADGEAFESWIDSDTIIDGQNAGSSWDVVRLGAVFLPGVVTVDGLEIGRDVDVQKRRKKEKARLRDNGLSPCAFDIICELTGKQWADWLRVLPAIQPKEGGVRTPLQIEHPLVNAHGIVNIYVHRIKIDAPSPRKGMKITIKVGEWFEEEKEAKGPSTQQPNSLVPAYSKPDYYMDPNKLTERLQGNAGVVNESAARDNLFEGDPPPDLRAGQDGWHGFRRQPEPLQTPLKKGLKSLKARRVNTGTSGS